MIQIKNLNKSYQNIDVLKDVNLEIKKGEIFGIIGQSGAGKSTLLRCINGLEKYNKGSIKISGKEIGDLSDNSIRNLRKNMGMIFQNFNLLNSLNVFENAALPLKVWGYDKNYIDKKVIELLELVGLKDKAKSKIKELSGGQKQRVAIARALTLNPEILLCDEATSALDPKTTKSILLLLKDINEKMGLTIVIVTHQMDVIKEACHRVALMEDGFIKAYGAVEELFLKPNDNLERLICEDEPILQEGVNIKIFFPARVSQKSIITAMARELDIDFSITWGRLERFRENVLGSLIINAPEKNSKDIIKYLDQNSISWEVIHNAN